MNFKGFLQKINLSKNKKKTSTYKRGILLAATKDSAFTIGTLLANIKYKMNDEVDIFYIINDGFAHKDKLIMQKLYPEAEFKFLDFSLKDFTEKIKTYNPNFKLDTNHVSLSRYTHMTYARFEALQFLQECESIIYLDFDMLLLKSIKELFTIKEKGFEVACCRGSATMSAGGGGIES